jgi:hypothetical protein
MGKSKVQELEALEPDLGLFLKQRQLPASFRRDRRSFKGKAFQE